MRTRSGPGGARLLRSAVTASASVASNRGRDDRNRERKGRGGRARTPRRRGQVSGRTKCADESSTHAGSVSTRRVFGSEEEPSCGRWHHTGVTVLIMCVRGHEGQIVGFKGAGARITEITHYFPRMFAFDGSKSKWTSEAASTPLILRRVLGAR